MTANEKLDMARVCIADVSDALPENAVEARTIIKAFYKELCRCDDCGLPYSEFGVDTCLAAQQWKAVCPEGGGDGGLLCANCICKRISKLSGPTVLYCWIDRVDYSQPYQKELSKEELE